MKTKQILKFLGVFALVMCADYALGQSGNNSTFNTNNLKNEVQQGSTDLKEIAMYICYGIAAIASIWVAYIIWFQKNDARQAIVQFIVAFIFVAIALGLGLL